jgi:hypothetical protein
MRDNFDLNNLDESKLKMTMEDAKKLINQYEGKKPHSLIIFLEYLGITESEFNSIIAKTVVPPFVPNFDAEFSTKTADFESWYRETAEDQGIRRKSIQIKPI